MIYFLLGTKYNLNVLFKQKKLYKSIQSMLRIDDELLILELWLWQSGCEIFVLKLLSCCLTLRFGVSVVVDVDDGIVVVVLANVQRFVFWRIADLRRLWCCCKLPFLLVLVPLQWQWRFGRRPLALHGRMSVPSLMPLQTEQLWGCRHIIVRLLSNWLTDV